MTKQQIGNYIRDRRVQLKLAKRQVCIRAGISNRAILDNIEAGRGYSMDTFIKVCEVLEIDFSKVTINETKKVNYGEDEQD